MPPADGGAGGPPAATVNASPSRARKSRADEAVEVEDDPVVGQDAELVAGEQGGEEEVGLAGSRPPSARTAARARLAAAAR